MITWTGENVNLREPEKGSINIRDIAHALSNICRYGGHCEFYSVAEHCVLLSRYAQQLHSPGRLPLLLLLHDAAEAYLGDTVAPDKTKEFEQREADFITVIYDALGVPVPEVSEASVALDLDVRIRHDECLAIRAPEQNAHMTAAFAPLGIRIFKWRPYRAEEEFLNQYWSL